MAAIHISFYATAIQSGSARDCRVAGNKIAYLSLPTNPNKVSVSWQYEWMHYPNHYQGFADAFDQSHQKAKEPETIHAMPQFSQH